MLFLESNEKVKSCVSKTDREALPSQRASEARSVFVLIVPKTELDGGFNLQGLCSTEKARVHRVWGGYKEIAPYKFCLCALQATPSLCVSESGSIVKSVFDGTPIV
jgi:hypothetical protein